MACCFSLTHCRPQNVVVAAEVCGAAAGRRTCDERKCRSRWLECKHRHHAADGHRRSGTRRHRRSVCSWPTCRRVPSSVRPENHSVSVGIREALPGLPSQPCLRGWMHAARHQAQASTKLAHALHDASPDGAAMTPGVVVEAFPLILEAKEILIASESGFVWFSHTKTRDVMGVYDWGDDAAVVDVIYIPRKPDRVRHACRLCRDRFKPWSLSWGDPELAEFGDGMYVISRVLAWPAPNAATGGQ